MRAHHPWSRLLGIIWGVCFGPAAAADAPAAPVPVCQRTPRVRDALARATCPRCACADVTLERLASLRQLSLRKLGLSQLKPGDLSGLNSLETLDLTGNPLKTLPSSLAAELGALKGMRLDLILFTRLPDAVVTPLLDRPGFNWDLAHPVRTCGPYTARAQPEEPILPVQAVHSLIGPFTAATEIQIHAWIRGTYLVEAWDNEGNVQLFALTRDGQQHLSILARTEQPIPMVEFSSSLDFAPYRLSSTELGFGLRRLKRATVPVRLDAEEEELQVFRIRQDRIERVLKTVVYTHKEKLHPPPEDTQATPYKEWHWEELTCSLIAVSRSSTRGIFNWVKVQSRAVSGKPPDGPPPGTDSPSVVFRWTGDHYEAQGDPTPSLFFTGD